LLDGEFSDEQISSFFVVYMISNLCTHNTFLLFRY
jgi:hypothetical protein